MEFFERIGIDLGGVETGLQRIVAIFDQILEVIIRREHAAEIGSIA